MSGTNTRKRRGRISLFPLAVSLIRRLACRASRDSFRFQFGKNAALQSIIEHDPADQRHNHHDAGTVGGDDEPNMVRHLHGQPATLACSKQSVRTRHRKISLRMAASKSVTNKSVNAAVISRSGMRIVGSMVEPPTRSTDAPWCSVFHQSTENLMIGRSIAPTSVRIATARAAR